MNSRSKQRLIVGISGGVDSAVAALLLVRDGHEVQGLHMNNWDDDDQTIRKLLFRETRPLFVITYGGWFREHLLALFQEHDVTVEPLWRWWGRVSKEYRRENNNISPGESFIAGANFKNSPNQ